MSLATAIIRGAQLILAVIVLGLSISLAKTQRFGSVPATTAYSAFTGGWGAVASIVGVAALYIEALAGIIMVGIDALTALLYLAGGIAVFVGLKGLSCNVDIDSDIDMADYDLLNGGCGTDGDGNQICGIGFESDSTSKIIDIFNGRCKQDQADGAFMLIAFVTALAVAGLAFWQSKKGTRSSGVVV